MNPERTTLSRRLSDRTWTPPRQATEHPSANGARPTVLVTGGSGFIGSHVVDVLARRGYKPRIFDLRESPHHEPGSIETVLGDATDTAALVRAMDGCDAVIHLAAMADVGHVQKADPAGAERLNSRATSAVLEAARETGVKRVVYGSTIWVYSDCADTAVDEDTPLAHPAHLYTATKLAGELYCRSYAELYGVEYTILRFGIPYGPRARVAAVVPAMVEKALGGEPLTVAGDGSQGAASSTSRTWPRAWSRASAPGRQPRLQPRGQRDHHDPRDRPDREGHGRRRRDRPHRGPRRRLRRQGGLERARPGRARMERGDPVPGGGPSLRRVAARARAGRRRPGRPAEGRHGSSEPPWRQRLVPTRRLLPSPRQAPSVAAVAGASAGGLERRLVRVPLEGILGGSPTTSVRTTRPEVGLVVDAPPALAGSSRSARCMATAAPARSA